MPRDLILGTAGHIDHGKTALVKALTGIDCEVVELASRGILQGRATQPNR